MRLCAVRQPPHRHEDFVTGKEFAGLISADGVLVAADAGSEIRLIQL
jgi:hypothetical protein